MSSADSIRELIAASVLRRKELLAELAAGSLGLEELWRLAQAEADVGATKTVNVVQLVPGVGKVKARLALALLQIDQVRPFGTLSGTEFESLVGALDG